MLLPLNKWFKKSVNEENAVIIVLTGCSVGEVVWQGWDGQWRSQWVTMECISLGHYGWRPDSKIEHWSLLWVLAEGWPRVVGSISERPCHAVTISGFFWSAKFFQIRNAPSSGERERERVGWGDKRQKIQKATSESQETNVDKKSEVWGANASAAHRPSTL